MTAIYLQNDSTIPYVPAANVNAGDVIVAGGIVAVAKSFIGAGVLGAVARTGMYLVEKAAVAFAIGQELYWDLTNDVVTTTPAAGANPYFGRATAAALSTDATAPVLLGADRVPKQPVIAALVDNSGGTAATTLAVIPATPAQADLANAVASLTAQINTLTAALKAAGLVATA